MEALQNQDLRPPTYKELRKAPEAIAHMDKFAILVLRAVKPLLRQDSTPQIGLVQLSLVGEEEEKKIGRDRSGSIGRLVRHDGAESSVAFSLRLSYSYLAIAKLGHTRVEVRVQKDGIEVTTKPRCFSLEFEIKEALQDLDCSGGVPAAIAQHLRSHPDLVGKVREKLDYSPRREGVPYAVFYRFTYGGKIKTHKNGLHLDLLVKATEFTLKPEINSPSYWAIAESLEQALGIPLKLDKLQARSAG